ncbi:HD domain-containing protein [Candidatus Woesebacteria bacterium]|nr:HD domain-containing protein [Candidatus Woesebacteria bacterium]
MLETRAITISIEALYILYLLQKNSFEGYIVGGAVRDTLLNALGSQTSLNATSLTASDYDFTTNAKPEQIQEIFPEHFYENTFGTVGVAREHLLEQMNRVNATTTNDTTQPESSVINLDQATKIHESLKKNQHDSLEKSEEDSNQSSPKDIYEITTFRSDGTYSDHRRPNEVTWGDSLKEDLSRRDFTINALAIKINQSYLNTIDFTKAPNTLDIDSDHFEVIDLHEGTTDLEAGIITTVGNPNKRFSEDALRMLRAVRFSVQLNMQIEDATFEAIVTNSQLLKHISFERIRDEFLKMLQSDFPKEAIEILDQTGLLKFILPELIDGKGVMQGGHHTTDVWTHNLDAIGSCPSKDPIVRLATLLHDIAKPHTYKEIDGKPTFYNHEIIGSRMAKNIARRLRLSNQEIDRIFLLVRYHMFYYQPEHTDASIRRFMRKVGLENINDILDLREADRLGSGARKTSWRLEEMKERMISQLHQPFAITDMAINGHDLMEQLELKPGPQLGKILNELFEMVLENPDLNTKETLLAEAKKLL